MIRTNVPPDRLGPRACFLLPLLLWGGGCGSPPSVVPVMQVVEATLQREAQSLSQVQAARDRLYLEQARRQLDEGYRRDLASTQALSPQWVESATSVYVAAREALLRQEIELARQRETRVENLQLAAQAQGRAVALLQRQDNLLRQTLGLDLWRIDLDDDDTAASATSASGLASPRAPLINEPPTPAAGNRLRDLASYLRPETRP